MSYQIKSELLLFQLVSGYIHRIDAMVCGMVAHEIGAGRQKAGDKINLAVGLQLRNQAGAFTEKGTGRILTELIIERQLCSI